MPKRLTFNHPWIDESQAPVYIIRMPASRTTETISGLWETIEAAYEAEPEPEPFAWITLTDYSAGSLASGRTLLAEHLTKVTPYLKLHCVGTAGIVDSSFARGVMTAIKWLRGSRYKDLEETINVASLEEGIAILRARIEARALEDAGKTAIA